jgi:hypothetical protein
MRDHDLRDNLALRGHSTPAADRPRIRVENAKPSGLRAAANFGIVTQFELALHPVGPIVYAGPIFYPADDAGALLRLFRDWSADTPDDVTGFVTLMTAPPLPVIPEEWHGKKVAGFIAVSAGPVDDGAAMVGDFRTVAEPIADLLGPMPYTMIQSLIDPLWPKGINPTSRRRTWPRSTTACRRALELHHRRVPSARSRPEWAAVARARGRNRLADARCRSC